MLPREHGAYAQLVLPLVAALAASRPTLASASYAMSALCAFVAHEPALVLLGLRGSRARRESARSARLWLVATLSAATLFGAVALALSPVSRTVVWLPVMLGLATGGMAMRHRERSLAGEAIACAALASAAVPTAVAGRLAWQDAVALWGTFCAAFLISTVEVRSVARRRASGWVRLATWTTAIAVVTGVALTRPLLALSPLPVLVVVAYAAIRGPSATALRRLGWMLATSALLTAVAAVVALRASRPSEGAEGHGPPRHPEVDVGAVRTVLNMERLAVERRDGPRIQVPRERAEAAGLAARGERRLPAEADLALARRRVDDVEP
jgi:hypothetical protein